MYNFRYFVHTYNNFFDTSSKMVYQSGQSTELASNETPSYRGSGYSLSLR